MTTLTPPARPTKTGIRVGDLLIEPNGRVNRVVWTAWDRVRVVTLDGVGPQVVYPLTLDEIACYTHTPATEA